MLTWCERCNKNVPYNTIPLMEEFTIRSVNVRGKQFHAYCIYCGQDVYPGLLFDENIDLAHNAYRTAIGAITTHRLQEIIDNLGTTPERMSVCLGLEPDSVARFLKGTVPSKEQSEQIESLYHEKTI